MNILVTGGAGYIGSHTCKALSNAGFLPITYDNLSSGPCSTYGVPQRIPITEEHPQALINPYGASKLMIERMLADFGAAYGMHSVSLHYFNAAGADPDGEIW